MNGTRCPTYGVEIGVLIAIDKIFGGEIE